MVLQDYMFLKSKLFIYLHAIRISIGLQPLVVNQNLTWLSELLSYLIIVSLFLLSFLPSLSNWTSTLSRLLKSWSGSIFTKLILYQPISQLVSFEPVLIYVSTHLITKRIKLSLIGMKWFDCYLLPLLDGLLRVSTISSAIQSSTTHHHPEYADSLILQIFLGIISTSTSSLISQSFSITSSNLKLNRPQSIQDPNFINTLDLWSGALIASVYGFLLGHHPHHQTLSTWIGLKPHPQLSILHARAICSILLTFIYSWRAHQNHIHPSIKTKILRSSSHVSSSTSTPVNQTKKTQWLSLFFH